MDSIQKALEAYYNYVNAQTQKLKEQYPTFDVYNSMLGISLISKN